MSDNTTKPAKAILSVSQLNRAAKDTLETAFTLLWVEGELTNFSRPSSGHWYFTLKDSRAQVRCAMFKGRNFAVRFRPENGKKVLVRANVSLYEGRGDYQLIVDYMEPAGAGDLQQQFELTKAKLQAEGLFEPERKKPLPKWPSKLAVITSPSGAAIHDILHVLQRRYPLLPVTVVPTAVQGADAAPQIISALKLVNQYKLADVIILARGGGSLEDLWSFNDESVARAIAASTIPIVSAVGHEVDFTISDFAADYRAPTPSAAAEVVSPNSSDLLDVFVGLESILKRTFKQNLAQKHHRLEQLTSKLRHPKERLLQQAQTLDRIELRLKRAWLMHWRQLTHQLDQLQTRLTRSSLQTQIHLKQQHITALKQRLVLSQKQVLDNRRQRFERSLALLHNLSPLNTLRRGYAIVSDQSGTVVHSAEQVSKGQTIHARLNQGSVIAEVVDCNSD